MKSHCFSNSFRVVFCLSFVYTAQPVVIPHASGSPDLGGVVNNVKRFRVWGSEFFFLRIVIIRPYLCHYMTV